MCNKYKITSPLFFRITSDQYFFLRFKVKWVSHLMVIFFCDDLFDVCEFYCRNLTDIRKFYPKNFQFSVIFFFQQFHCILKKSCFHCHNIFKSINIAHLKIKTCILVQMTLCVMLFRSEYRCCLEHSVEYTDHHLFIELWALCQYSRSVEIFQFENIGSAFCTFCPDLRCMDLCKLLTVQEISECSCKSFLNSEFRTFPDISKRNGTVV